jgi:hypothetical protein
MATWLMRSDFRQSFTSKAWQVPVAGAKQDRSGEPQSAHKWLD